MFESKIYNVGIYIRLSHEDEDKRIITITPHGSKYEELCEAVLW